MLHEIARLAAGATATMGGGESDDEAEAGAGAEVEAGVEARTLAVAAVKEHGFEALAMRSLRRCFRADQAMRAGCKGAAARALALVQHLSECLPVPEPIAPMPMNEDWKRTGLTFAIDA